MTEPLIHSFETDVLPDEHPWAHETVHCGQCRVMVHAFNNECMQVWVEWEGRALCWSDFLAISAEGPAFNEFKEKASRFASIDK